MVYLTGEALRVYALDPTGATRWQFAVSGSTAKFLGGPALASDGTIYAVNSARTIYALDGATGVQRWKLTVGTAGSVIAAPIVDPNGTIYFITDKGYVYAVNPNGTIKWSYNTAVALSVSPVLGPNGVVYVVNTGGKLMFALNTATGLLKFKFTAAGLIRANPVVSTDGRVFLPVETGLYGFDASGIQRFYFPASGGKFTTSPVLSADQQTIYATVLGTNLYAINTNSGAKQWQYILTGKASSSPALDAIGNIIIGTDLNYLFILNSERQVDPESLIERQGHPNTSPVNQWRCDNTSWYQRHWQLSA